MYSYGSPILADPHDAMDDRTPQCFEHEDWPSHGKETLGVCKSALAGNIDTKRGRCASKPEQEFTGGVGAT